MILFNLDELISNPGSFLLWLFKVALALVVGLTVHESSHALVAHRLGDDTARRLGRLSLNPLRHLDPVGTVLFLLAGFGWAKPVPVNPYYLRRGRLDMALVAVAGPISNVVVTFLVAIPMRLGLVPGVYLSELLAFVIFFNLLIAAINLIPIFPLDGSKIMMGIVPSELTTPLARLERYGPMVLILVILVEYTTSLGLLRSFIGLVSDATGALV